VQKLLNNDLLVIEIVINQNKKEKEIKVHYQDHA
jgi:hypothetical protein